MVTSQLGTTEALVHVNARPFGSACGIEVWLCSCIWRSRDRSPARERDTSAASAGAASARSCAGIRIAASTPAAHTQLSPGAVVEIPKPQPARRREYIDAVVGLATNGGALMVHSETLRRVHRSVPRFDHVENESRVLASAHVLTLRHRSERGEAHDDVPVMSVERQQRGTVLSRHRCPHPCPHPCPDLVRATDPSLSAFVAIFIPRLHLERARGRLDDVAVQPEVGVVLSHEAEHALESAGIHFVVSVEEGHVRDIPLGAQGAAAVAIGAARVRGTLRSVARELGAWEP